MAENFSQPRLLSVEALIALLVALVLALGTMSWWFRLILVLFGLGLVAHLSQRLPRRHTATRIVFGIISGAFLISVTWQSIWDDFHSKYPTVIPDASHWFDTEVP